MTVRQFGLTLALALACMASPLRALDVPYNAIQAPERTPTIDGTITPGEWPEEYAVHQTRAFHDERAITLYFATDSSFLYMAASVRDAHLWADGNGAGAGNLWDHYNDDSIEWYFDPDTSRDATLSTTDRMFAVNIGNRTDPTSGGGVVSRRSWNRGTGDGSGYGLDWPSSLVYKVRHDGTVNNDADTDTGYSIEVAIPWSAIGRSAPADGDAMGVNVIAISDDTGGSRDWSDNRSIEPASARFTTPIRPDEYQELRMGSQSGSQSGLYGPVNYAVMQFHRNGDTTPPAAVTSLRTYNVRPMSAVLDWLCPGDNGTQGVAAGFDVRYATGAISDANFESAAKWPTAIFPLASGYGVKTVVCGLTPGQSYYFAVRAFDEAGNVGAISTTGPVTTPTLAAAGAPTDITGYRGGVRVAPCGRYFITENGASLSPIGTHVLFANEDMRYLYNASVWTGVSQWTSTGLYNYHSDDPDNARPKAYLDSLKAKGITVMRLFLEDLTWPVKNNGVFNSANGAYWIEYPRGTFNTKMASFLTDLMRLCAERGIYLILSPFDTYRYNEDFTRTVYSTANGGPISNINQFFESTEVLQMCKDRMSWVINTVQSSAYSDAVLGYEVVNEWDSWEWTRVRDDANEDAKIRTAFIGLLAAHVRSLDMNRLLLCPVTAIDPRGALAASMLSTDTFDALLPHLYLPGNREPWNNPESFKGRAVVREQRRAIGWWTLNQLDRKPVLNGEWGPSDGWHPTPSKAQYISSFTEDDDNTLTRLLWFTELCSGAAGPGVRMQGGVRAYSYGLKLSDAMNNVASSLGAFIGNGTSNSAFRLAEFNSRHRSADVTCSNGDVLVNACSDGRKGLAYLVHDQTKSTGAISGATLTIGGLDGGSRLAVEFWKTEGAGSTPLASPESTVIAVPVMGTAVVSVPSFTSDIAVKFYETASARVSARRENGNLILGMDVANGSVYSSSDTYVVLDVNGIIISLYRTGSGIGISQGLTKLEGGGTPRDGREDLLTVPVSALAGVTATCYLGIDGMNGGLAGLKSFQAVTLRF